jgi:hypothetical protein
VQNEAVVFLTGVNFPWLRYGGDLGRSVWGVRAGAASAALAAELAQLAAAGVDVVRWFLFADARGGLTVERDGLVGTVQSEAWEDLDALLACAAGAGVRLVPVLFDHPLVFRQRGGEGGVALGGHADWLATPEGQARLLERVIAPLAARYGARGPRGDLGAAVFAWDLLNEPDWIVREMHPQPAVERPIVFDQLAAWVRQAAALLHARGAGRVTIGGCRLRYVSWWDDPRLGLDLLQAHAYYDPRHDYDVTWTPARALARLPVVLGEVTAGEEPADPPRGRPALASRDLVRIARQAGYAGAWPWSWRGVDAHGRIATDTLATLAALRA